MKEQRMETQPLVSDVSSDMGPCPFACYMNCEQTVFLTGPVPQGICGIQKTNQQKPK